MEMKRFLALLICCALVACGGCGDSGSSSSGGLSDTVSSADTPTAEKPAAVQTDVQPQATGWGHLKGRFVYDGTPPQPTPLQVTKDPEFCGKFGLVDESLVVNADGGGVANVVVHLYLGRGDDAPEPHESYADLATAEVKLDNNQCRFVPRVCVMTTSQTLKVLNSDTVGHNTNLATMQNPGQNLVIPAGGTIEQQYSNPERMPVGVSCNIHPWMNAYLLVQDHPYADVSDQDGGFELKNLPAGVWTFQVWHEKAGYVSDVTVDGQATEWSKGRVELTIKPDETIDLGEIKITPAMFEK